MTKQVKGKTQAFVKDAGSESSGWTPNERGWYTLFAGDIQNEEASTAFRMTTEGHERLKAAIEKRMGFPVNLKVRRNNVSFTRSEQSASKPRNVW